MVGATGHVRLCKVINHEYYARLLLPRGHKSLGCMEQVQVYSAHSKSLRGVVENDCYFLKTKKEEDEMKSWALAH